MPFPLSLRSGAAVVALVLGPACAALGQTPSFTIIPAPPGATAAVAVGVSADGSSAGGYSYIPSTSFPGFRWTAAGGRYDFGLNEPGVPIYTQSSGISGDGGTVVGRAYTQATGYHAFRWSGPGTYQDLGTLPGLVASEAQGVSGDGSIVVGRGHNLQDTVGVPFRWTQQTGMVSLGQPRPEAFYTNARAISRDGSTIVGSSINTGNIVDAFTWTQSGGYHFLPHLPNSQFGSQAAGVNFDGSIVVGASGPGTNHPAMWVNDQVTDLGLTAGWTHGFAVLVSDDGSVVVGSVGNSSTSQAEIWTPSRGAESLESYFLANGVPLPAGWTGTGCLGISADGKTFVGAGSGGAFVAVVPGPGGFPFGLFVLFSARRRPRPPARGG